MSQRLSDDLSRIATVVLVVLACAWTAGTVYTRLASPRVQLVPARTLGPTDSLLPGGYLIGNNKAPLRIIVFSDYQCPGCRQLWQQAKEIRRAHHDSVAFLAYHYPLSSHLYATEAAVSSVCAANQGQFAAYHFQLFEHQDSLTATSWTNYAKASGVSDTVRFQACLNSSAASASVAADVRAGDRLHIEATPTFIIGSEMFVGAPRDLERIVALKLAHR